MVVALLGLGSVSGCSPAASESDQSASRTPVSKPDVEPSSSATSSPDTGPDPDRTRGHRGTRAGSNEPATPPDQLVLPGGTRMGVVTATTGDDGALELATDVRTAVWWDGGSRLGDPFGSMVVAAHVDSFTQGLGPFAQLLEMDEGDRVVLGSEGRRQTFEVERTRFVPRASLSADAQTFSTRGPLRLVLITCGGPYDRDAGGYQDNVVVTAIPVDEGPR